jgi:hypothetical protein
MMSVPIIVLVPLYIFAFIGGALLFRETRGSYWRG